jgi:scyllo-inositol 2-dehydrogenase (NADP+)
MPPSDPAAPSAAPIRVGLIGHGLSGAYFHAPLLEAAADFRIEAIATSRAESLRGRRDAPRAVRDPLAVCCAPDVDLVVIASPNDRHFGLARAALEAGKHVVIDKPFVLSTREADELIGLARARSRLLAVFHNRRFDGDFLAVTHVVKARAMGDLLLFESRWDRFKTSAAEGWRWGTAPGAGLLWDLGPHLIDQALQLFGTPDRWTSDIGAQRAGAVVDDYFELTLWYGRMRCILSASISVAAARPRFALHGTNGSFVTSGVDPYEAALRRGEQPGKPGFRERLPQIPAYRIDVDGNRHAEDLEAGQWERFYPGVAAAIRRGTPASSSAEHAVPTIALIESAYAFLASR